jgi:hypothetical protein
MGCQRGAEGLRADMSGREQAVAIHEEQEEEVDARADARGLRAAMSGKKASNRAPVLMPDVMPRRIAKVGMMQRENPEPK